MKKLSNPRETMKIIEEHGFRFQKRYGQNFLIDGNVLDRIVSCADLHPSDRVLEIGPGIGTLTQELAARAGQVIAVEIDSHLIPILENTLSGCANVQILHADILKMDLPFLLENGSSRSFPAPDSSINPAPAENPAPASPVLTVSQPFPAPEALRRPWKVVANLPYYITTPVLLLLLEKRLPLQSITVMVQKEVAERIQAAPGGKDYGALSLAVQYYAEAKLVLDIPPACFLPRPAVSSAVLQLLPYEKAPVQTANEGFLFRLIHAAFSQRRKTLQNALSSVLKIEKPVTAAALLQLGLPADIRGERLSLTDFAALSDLLYSQSPVL